MLHDEEKPEPAIASLLALLEQLADEADRHALDAERAYHDALVQPSETGVGGLSRSGSALLFHARWVRYSGERTAAEHLVTLLRAFPTADLLVPALDRFELELLRTRTRRGALTFALESWNIFARRIRATLGVVDREELLVQVLGEKPLRYESEPYTPQPRRSAR